MSIVLDSDLHLDLEKGPRDGLSHNTTPAHNTEKCIKISVSMSGM